ncbi:hypothetical protein Q7P37_002316 [Cladosporium fusiforme]
MSSVQIFHRNKARDETLVSVVDGDRIKAHSGTIRDMLLTLPPQIIYRVVLRGPSPEAFRHVVQQVHFVDSRTTLFIPMRGTGLAEAIGIQQAITILQLEPAQSHVEGHINGYISHKGVSPAELSLVQEVYGHAYQGTTGHKIWTTMVAALAYRDVQGHDGDEEATASLREAALPYPSLRNAINKKCHQLRKIKETKEQTARKRAARAAVAAAKAATNTMTNASTDSAIQPGGE